MISCRDVERQATAYVDGEASADDHTAVAEHLTACPSCRRHVAQQDTARTVVRARALVLVSTAPFGLRARCTPVVPPAWRILPWAVAASVVIAPLVLVTLTTRSTTVLAAQLAVDHMKCFEFPGTPNPDSQALEAKLASGFGWRMVVPPGSVTAGLALLTARRCLYIDGRVAHLMYRHHDRPVSLFVLPDTTRVPDEVRVMGHEAVVWSSHRDRKSYVLIGREPREELEQLAKYVQSTLPK